MYAFVKGKLSSATVADAVVDAHGVGYLLHIPVSAYGQLPPLGDEVFFYTFFIVREQMHALYGFLTRLDRDIFEILLGISSVGPKTALSIVGHLDPIALGKAVAHHDVATISKVPGIGKKTAERIILEIRDKLPAVANEEHPSRALNPSDPRAQQISDAMSALINLGYNQAAAQKAIKRSLQDLPETANLAQLITLSLKHV